MTMGLSVTCVLLVLHMCLLCLTTKFLARWNLDVMCRKMLGINFPKLEFYVKRLQAQNNDHFWQKMLLHASKTARRNILLSKFDVKILAIFSFLRDKTQKAVTLAPHSYKQGSAECVIYAFICACHVAYACHVHLCVICNLFWLLTMVMHGTQQLVMGRVLVLVLGYPSTWVFFTQVLVLILDLG